VENPIHDSDHEAIIRLVSNVNVKIIQEDICWQWDIWNSWFLFVQRSSQRLK